MRADAYMRCTRCALELTEAESRDLTCCPRCKTKGLPMLVADDVTINVNWHELRILGIWAENYASASDERHPSEDSMQRLVNIIAGRIHAQHPEKAPLTMTGELGELRRWADENAGGMEIKGFKPDTGAEPGLEPD